MLGARDVRIQELLQALGARDAEGIGGAEGAGSKGCEGTGPRGGYSTRKCTPPLGRHFR